MLELASPSDRESVNALAREVHAMHVRWKPESYEMIPELYSKERFENAIRQRQLYVAKLEGTVIGYVLLVIRTMEGPGRKKRKLMLAEEICVAEGCRGQGIGKEMMADASVLARVFGCDGLQLGVDPHNDAAVGFYQKCGFRISGISMQKML